MGEVTGPVGDPVPSGDWSRGRSGPVWPRKNSCSFQSGNSPFRCGRPSNPPPKSRADARKTKTPTQRKNTSPQSGKKTKAQKHHPKTKKTPPIKVRAYARKTKKGLFQKLIGFAGKPEIPATPGIPALALFGTHHSGKSVENPLVGCRVVIIRPGDAALRLHCIPFRLQGRRQQAPCRRE